MARESPPRSHPLRVALRRWSPSASMTIIAVILLADGWSEARTVVASALLLVLAGLLSPWLFPRSQPDAAARRRACASEVPLVYWRPGCVFCLRLRLALGRLGNRAVWVGESSARPGAAGDRRRVVTATRW